MALQADCGGDAEPDEQVIVDVSFHEPADALQRFKALVRDFRLQPIEVTHKLEEPKSAKSRGMKKPQARFKRISLEELQPRWKLFTTCQMMW